MRIVTAWLGYISEYGDDKEEKEAKKLAKRIENMAKVGVVVSQGTDLKHPTVTLTESQVVELMLLGEDVDVRSSAMVDEDRIMRAAEVIEAVASKLERFAGGIIPDKPDTNAFNDRVEVYTPGAGLMLFNRILLLQDECSDALQTELDNGWRIIAACPQPDQRRPDYILGRYDPKYADNESGARNSALRG